VLVSLVGPLSFPSRPVVQIRLRVCCRRTERGATRAARTWMFPGEDSQPPPSLVKRLGRLEDKLGYRFENKGLLLMVRLRLSDDPVTVDSRLTTWPCG
jgi:hypothetical protein